MGLSGPPQDWASTNSTPYIQTSKGFSCCVGIVSLHHTLYGTGSVVCPVCRKEFSEDEPKAAHVNMIKHDTTATKLIKETLKRIKEEATPISRPEAVEPKRVE